MAKNKKYNIKIFDSTGTLITTVQPSLILSEIEFDSQLNGGVGSINVELDLTFDNFENEVSFIDIHNSIKIFEFDGVDNPDGKQVFTGEVMQVTPVLKNERETVTLLCSGLSALFNNSIFKQGASFTPTYSAVDPSAIATDIVDQVISLTPFLNYSTVGLDQSVFSVGTNVSIDFDAGTTWWDAMQAVVELAGAGWNWFVDGEGKFWFREMPSNPTHIIQVQENVGEIENEIDGTEIVNDVTIAYDGGTFNKTDAASIALYGTRIAYIDEFQIKDVTTAEQRADKELEKSVPVRRVDVELNSKYNFETVTVGDTLKVRGLKAGSISLDSNALIVGLSYTPDIMTVTLGEFTSLANEIAKIA